MKKLILAIIFAVYALTNAQAAYCPQCPQEHDWYAQATGSFGWHNDSKFKFNKSTLQERQKTGFGGSIAIGRIIDAWRLELEASYRENSSKSKLTTSNTSLMANVYYDIPAMECLSFYIGAGAGISSVNGKVNDVEFKQGSTQFKKRSGHLDNVFAWQIMAGATYALSEDWDLVAGYRLFGTAKPTLAKLGNDRLKMTSRPISNNVEIGLRFKF